MTITLTFGYWIVPLLITIVSFLIVTITWFVDRSQSGSDLDGFFARLFVVIAFLISLSSWLTWALSFCFN